MTARAQAGARPCDTVKRVIDVVGAAAGLLLTSPAQAAVALLVWRNLGRPVLFRQQRPGLYGRPFTLVKFRTMLGAEDPCGPVRDADRLTRFGARLRATSLDELPTLWNVLRGDMSLVGPRPLLMQYLPRYTAEQARRHQVRPGITGLAQVTGRNLLSWEEKFTADVQYVDRRSLALDVRIMALTVRAVAGRDGISAAGQATALEFQGSSQCAAS